MSKHCAECGKRLRPIDVHRCDRCGMPFCRQHVKRHDCEPDTREGLLSWATSLGPAPQPEEKGSLPMGATYRRPSAARLYRIDVAERASLFIVGVGVLAISLTGSVPLSSDLRISAVILGFMLSLIGGVLLARTFGRMNGLSSFTTFVIGVVFVAIPGLVWLLLA